MELGRSNHRKYTRVNKSSSVKRLALKLRMTVPLDRVINKLTGAGFIVNSEAAPRFL